MQGEQRERLIALATKIAAENDPAKFQALILELKRAAERAQFPGSWPPKNLPGAATPMKSCTWKPLGHIP
jgi:hypothetical protein